MGRLVALAALSTSIGCGGDGSSRGATFAGDPSQPGRYTVYTHGLTIPGSPASAGRDVNATLYAPSLDGGATIARDGAPFPLVVFLPGFGATHGLYATYSGHYASWGFIVVGIDFPDSGNHPQDAADTSATIDWALSDASPVVGLVDASRIAVNGHSLGGKISFFTADLDPRVSVVIAFDPVDAGGPPCYVPIVGPPLCNRWSIAPNSFDGDAGMMDDIRAATLILAAPPGAFSPPEHNAVHFWEGTKTPGEFVLFPSGTHLDWLGVEPVTTLSKRTALAWLLERFDGTKGLEPYLTGDVIQADVDAGTVTIQTR